MVILNFKISRRCAVQQTRRILLIVSILMLVLYGPALAQMGHAGEGGHGGKSPHGEMGHGKSVYDASCWTETLTEEQKAKVAQLRLEKKKIKYLTKAQIKAKKVELAILVTQDNPNQSAIEKKIEEILDLKREKMRKIYAIKIEIRKLLTPEQRVLFDMKMIKKAYHGKHHGHKEGHGER